MQEDVRNDLKSQLALMIARGKTINAWASQNDVPLRTAYRWSREPQVRGEVQEWRRYVLDLAIGRTGPPEPEGDRWDRQARRSAESRAIDSRAGKRTDARSFPAALPRQPRDQIALSKEAVRCVNTFS